MPVGRVDRKARNGMPTAFEDFADQMINLIDTDPFLLFSCHKPCAEKVLTRDRSSFPGSSPKHQEVLDRLAQTGNTGGIGIPFRTSENQVFGGWMFSSHEPEENLPQTVSRARP